MKPRVLCALYAARAIEGKVMATRRLGIQLTFYAVRYGELKMPQLVLSQDDSCSTAVPYLLEGPATIIINSSTNESIYPLHER